MKTLRELHKQAIEEKWAMPHFNFSNIEQLKALVEIAGELKSPFVAGLSEGERKAIGLRQAVSLIRSLRSEGVVIFLNADHSHTKESAIEAIEAGFDSIHIDLSKEEYEKNKQDTKTVVEYARNKSPKIEVEGELGYLMTDSSKIYKEAIEIPEESYTQPEQAKEYVEYTGVDRFSPVFGNIHGIAANKPVVKFDLIEKVRSIVNPEVILVVHGGSGIGDEDFKKLIQKGFNNAHISTELRVAYTEALRKSLKENPEEVAPYKYTSEAKEATKKAAAEKIKLFGSDGVLM